MKLTCALIPVFLALSLSPIVRGDMCPESVGCQNGGMLSCSTMCLSDGRGVNLKCTCTCPEQFFGPKCQFAVPCGDVYDQPTGPPTLPTPPPTTTRPPSEEPLEDVLVAAAYTAGLGLIHLVDPLHETKILTRGNIQTATVDWYHSIVYFSYNRNSNTGLNKIGFDGQGFENFYDSFGTQIRALAIDVPRQWLFFYERETQAIRRMTPVAFSSPTTIIASVGCTGCVLSIEVDSQTETFYYLEYFGDYLYTCSYTGSCTSASLSFMSLPVSSFLDVQNNILYIAGGNYESSMYVAKVYKYDLSTNGAPALLGSVPGIDMYFMGVALRGNTLYMRSYVDGACFSPGAYAGSLYSVPTAGGSITDLGLATSCEGWGME